MAGSVSLFAPSEQWTVLRTKSSGVLDLVVGNSGFIWRWEALIPTNVSFESFPTKEMNLPLTIEGVLDKGEDYSTFLGLKELFDFRIQVNLIYQWNPEKLPQLVREFGLASASIEEFLKKNQPEFEKNTRDWLLGVKSDQYNVNILVDNSDDKLAGLLQERLTGVWKFVSLKRIILTLEKSPDFKLYQDVRKTFNDATAAILAEQQARALVKSQIQIREAEKLELLEKYGQLLEKYPNLQFLLKENLGPEIQSIFPSLLPSSAPR